MYQKNNKINKNLCFSFCLSVLWSFPKLDPLNPAWMESQTFSLPLPHQQLLLLCNWKTELPVSLSGRLRGTRSKRDIGDEEDNFMSQRALQDCGQINIFIVHSRCRGIELNSVLFCLYHAFWSGLTNNRCTWGYYSGLPVCCRTIRR